MGSTLIPNSRTPELMAAMYKLGMSARQIGHHTGRSPATVVAQLRRHGINVPARSGPVRVLAWSDTDIALIYLAGRSARSIAAELGVSMSVIRKRLEAQGVEIRGRTEAVELLRQQRSPAAVDGP